MSHHNVLGANDSGLVDYKHLIGNAKQSVERRLNSVVPIYGHIKVQDFWQNLGIRHQALPAADKVFQESLRVGLVGMGTRSVSTLDFRKHTGDIARRKFVLCRGTNYVEFLSRARARFMPARQLQGAWRTHCAMDSGESGLPAEFPGIRVLLESLEGVWP
jgi:hypothetical protein